MNRRSLLQGVLVVVAIALAVAVIGPPDPEGPPLDPDSVGLLGTRALMDFVVEGGGEIRRGLPTLEDDTALVLQDRLSGGQREDLLAWVREGGSLVIADPSSPLVDARFLALVDADELDARTCTIAEFAQVESLAGDSLALLALVPGATGCFGSEATQGAVYLQRFAEGAGTVVALGGAIPLTNEQLDEADNAVLAGALIPDGARVAVVYTPVASGEARTLADLVGSNVRWFGWQLAVAAVVGVLWAIRRFGPLVAEPPVVELPGSLSVRATGELHRRSRSGWDSAATIQRSIAERVRSEHHLGKVSGSEAVAALAERTDADRAEIEAVYAPLGSGDGSALERSRRLDRAGRTLLAPRQSQQPGDEP